MSEYFEPHGKIIISFKQLRQDILEKKIDGVYYCENEKNGEKQFCVMDTEKFVEGTSNCLWSYEDTSKFGFNFVRYGKNNGENIIQEIENFYNIVMISEHNL